VVRRRQALSARYTPVTISAWTLLAGLAVVSTHLPALAYYSGLRCAEATQASIVATVEPVVALAIAGPDAVR
jgi:drug/metabolite transporter (DMT)-like permease